MDGLVSAALQTFILAGGLGTRLRPISGSTPKALMPIAGETFLDRLLGRLRAQRIRRVVLCLGYGAEAIIEHVELQPFADLEVAFSVEQAPRGTAGALRVAQSFWAEQNLILNGDTELQFDISHLCKYHTEHYAAVSIGLAQVSDAACYGRVTCTADGRLTAFLEKDGRHEPALVNAGVYLSDRSALERIPPESTYSIEKDWLPCLLTENIPVFGAQIAKEFIDIGTPDDYRRLINRG
jgi:NDP-sugar pyrophosphorylase family protein